MLELLDTQRALGMKPQHPRFNKTGVNVSAPAPVASSYILLRSIPATWSLTHGKLYCIYYILLIFTVLNKSR